MRIQAHQRLEVLAAGFAHNEIKQSMEREHAIRREIAALQNARRDAHASAPKRFLG